MPCYCFRFASILQIFSNESFIIQSDHKPLTFLEMNRTKNARLLRYALSLQPFAFKVEPIKGTENCISDVLSRF